MKSQYRYFFALTLIAVFSRGTACSADESAAKRQRLNTREIGNVMSVSFIPKSLVLPQPSTSPATKDEIKTVRLTNYDGSMFCMDRINGRTFPFFQPFQYDTPTTPDFNFPKSAATWEMEWLQMVVKALLLEPNTLSQENIDTIKKCFALLKDKLFIPDSQKFLFVEYIKARLPHIVPTDIPTIVKIPSSKIFIIPHTLSRDEVKIPDTPLHYIIQQVDGKELTTFIGPPTRKVKKNPPLNFLRHAHRQVTSSHLAEEPLTEEKLTTLRTSALPILAEIKTAKIKGISREVAEDLELFFKKNCAPEIQPTEEEN